MSQAEWIEKIAAERNRKRQVEEKEQQLEAERRRKFEAHAEKLWTRLHDRMIQATRQYNALVTEEDQIEIENSSESQSAWSMTLRRSGPRNASLFVCLSKETEEVVCGGKRLQVKITDKGIQLWDRRFIPEPEWDKYLLADFFQG